MLRPLVLFLCALLTSSVQATDLPTLEKSVVRIIVQTPNGVGSGTGSVVSQGIVLTNQHVVERAQRIVVASKHIAAALDARILWQSSHLDLAVLQVAGLNLPSVTLATAKPQKGEEVWVVGYPGASDIDSVNLDAALTRGVVSLFHHKRWGKGGTKVQIIQHDSAVNSGNSGGPLFDQCGRVLGVNTASSASKRVQGVYWASRITEAIPQLESMGINLQKSNDSCIASTSNTAADVAQAGHITIITGLITGILSVLAVILALRKPRQQIVKVVERITRASRKIAASPSARRNVKSNSNQRAVLMLAGFDTAGNKLRITVPAQGTSAAQGGYVIGRQPDLVDHAVEDPSISRRHARITVEHGQCQIEDMNSTNGTRVNGNRLSAFTPTPISAGDMILLAKIEMQVSSG